RWFHLFPYTALFRSTRGGRSARLRWRAAGAGLDRARLELSPIGLMVAASMPPDEWQARFLASGAHAASTTDIYVNTSRQAGKSRSEEHTSELQSREN